MDPFIQSRYYRCQNDIYQDNQGKYYIEVMNNLFDCNTHYGTLKTLNFTKVDVSKCRNLLDYKYVDHHNLDWIDSFVLNMYFNVFTQVKNLLKAEYNKSLNRKIHLIVSDGQEMVLTILSKADLAHLDLDMMLMIYLKLSELGLSPYVHYFGKIILLDCDFIYMVSDYIPLTIKDLAYKNDALKEALKIAESIRNLGLKGQNLVDTNFLYNNGRVYAVDFVNLRTKGVDFELVFYLSDLKKHVTSNEINSY
jgi:hypothetical protein